MIFLFSFAFQVVKKLREKAMLDAQKRIKQMEKLQVKASKRAEREGRKLAKMREQMISHGALVSKVPMPNAEISSNPQGRTSPSMTPRSASPSPYSNGVSHQVSSQPYAVPSTSKTNHSSAQSVSRSNSIRNAFQAIRNGSLRGSTRTNTSNTPSSGSFIIHDFSEPKPYSAHFYGIQKKGMLGGVAKKIKIKQKKQSNENQGEFKVSEQENGKRTVRSLTGLQRDFHVMYVRPDGTDDDEYKTNELLKSSSEPDFFSNRDSGIDSPESGTIEPASIFERPGFGSVAFISKRLKSSMMMSLPNESTDDDNTSSSIDGSTTTTVTPSSARIRRQASCTDSIGTVGSLARRMQTPGPESEEGNSYAPQTYLSQSQSLEVFMVVNNVIEYLPILIKEKIDLQALMLVTDKDLKDIGIPLGPRRKILSAINQHKDYMKQPVKTTVL